MILIEPCLSSVSMYAMGVYQLYRGDYQQLDLARSQFFFWQGCVGKKGSTIWLRWMH